MIRVLIPNTIYLVMKQIKIKKTILYLFIATIFISGCRHYFSEADKVFLDYYNVGDTLIFKSTNGHYDSIHIVEKDYRFSGLTESRAGNPQACDIYYESIPQGEPVFKFGGFFCDTYTTEHLFIDAVKWKPDRPAFINIHYKGFRGIFHSSFKYRKDSTDKRYIKLTSGLHYGHDSTDIIQMKWVENTGIAWYKQKNGIIWELVKEE